jgi:hypothetical protein
MVPVEMIHWMLLIDEDFVCGKCHAPVGERCKDPNGKNVQKDSHAERRNKLRHEKYVRGLVERCGWVRFGG